MLTQIDNELWRWIVVAGFLVACGIALYRSK